MKCPHCKKEIVLTAKQAAKALGAKGGSTKGATKARTPEQLKAAIAARWPLGKPRKAI